MNTRVSFYTLGCRLNQAETANLRKSFEEKGYQVVPFNDRADVVVVNTCTVTGNGDADTRKLVNRINRRNPQARIALVGCQAQIQREKLLEMPNVQWVVGNARKMEIAGFLQDHLQQAEPQVVTPAISRSSFRMPGPGVDRSHTRANLKIQDGCDFFCSFCVIPYARGRARSREFSDIMTEVRQLTDDGHREIVLTGINIGTYRYQNYTLTDIIRQMEQVARLERIRLSSIEPSLLPEEILTGMGQDSKLCRYLHIPLQSGSDRILTAMNRRYSTAEFAGFIEKVHRMVPGICLGTDVIAGFPGESDDCFDETYQFLKSLPLAYFHVFSYSERPWVKSRKLPGKVAEEVIEKRSRLLRELGAEKRHRYLKAKIGTVETVLFEQNKKGGWQGLTDTYIRVKVHSDRDLQNQILPVRLQAIDNNLMIGKLV